MVELRKAKIQLQKHNFKEFETKIEKSDEKLDNLLQKSQIRQKEISQFLENVK